MELSLDSVVLVSQIAPRWYRDNVDVVSSIQLTPGYILASASALVSGLEKKLSPQTLTQRRQKK